MKSDKRIGFSLNLAKRAKGTLLNGSSPQPVAFHSAIVDDQRKRSQRVLLRVRANIHVAVKGQQATLDATTLSVHSEGALVVLKQTLPPDTHLVLEHRGTREKVGCRVVRGIKEMPEGFHVSLKFDSPAPGFWRIAFPPLDWQPDQS